MGKVLQFKRPDTEQHLKDAEHKADVALKEAVDKFNEEMERRRVIERKKTNDRIKRENRLTPRKPT